MRFVFLLGGAVLGLSIALGNLLTGNSNKHPPQDTVARVGVAKITRSQLTQIINDLKADKRQVTKKDREFALNRLIDEELLIQRALELGLPTTEPSIRKSLSSAMISQIVAESEATPAGEDELRDFFRSDEAFFARNPRLRLRRLSVDGILESSRTQALEIHTRLLDGANFEQFQDQEGVRIDENLPDALLSVPKLMDYLGPKLVKTALTQESTGFVTPTLLNGKYHILHVVNYVESEVPSFEEVRDIVAAEFVRRKGDQALTSYLQWLRSRADVDVYVP